MATGDLTGRKVLVTGASGFIGRRLVASLVATGAEVTALGRTRHSAAALSGAPVRFVQGGLADADAVRKAVAGQEVIFNLPYYFRQSAAAPIPPEGCPERLVEPRRQEEEEGNENRRRGHERSEVVGLDSPDPLGSPCPPILRGS